MKVKVKIKEKLQRTEKEKQRKKVWTLFGMKSHFCVCSFVVHLTKFELSLKVYSLLLLARK